MKKDGPKLPAEHRTTWLKRMCDVESALFERSSETRTLGALSASIDTLKREEEGSLSH